MSKKVMLFYFSFIFVLFSTVYILSSCSANSKSSYLYKAKEDTITEILITCERDANSVVSLTNQEQISGFLELFPNKKVSYIEQDTVWVANCEGGCDEKKVDKEIQFTIEYYITIKSPQGSELLQASDAYISINNIDYERVPTSKSFSYYINSIRLDILNDSIENALKATLYDNSTTIEMPTFLRTLKEEKTYSLELCTLVFTGDLSLLVLTNQYYYFDDNTNNRIYIYENELYIAFNQTVYKIVGLNYNMKEDIATAIFNETLNYFDNTEDLYLGLNNQYASLPVNQNKLSDILYKISPTGFKEGIYEFYSTLELTSMGRTINFYNTSFSINYGSYTFTYELSAGPLGELKSLYIDLLIESMKSTSNVTYLAGADDEPITLALSNLDVIFDEMDLSTATFTKTDQTYPIENQIHLYDYNHNLHYYLYIDGNSFSVHNDYYTSYIKFELSFDIAEYLQELGN